MTAPAFVPFVFVDLTGAAFHVRMYRRGTWLFRWVPGRDIWNPLRPATIGEVEGFRAIALPRDAAAVYHARHARTRPGA